MNRCCMVGKLTKDIELKFSQDEKAIGKSGIAIQRDMKNKEGKYDADFINFVIFGKTAEFAANYSGKGKLVEIEGRWQTGSYEKDGRKVYTNELMVDKFKPLEWGEKTEKAATDEDGFTPMGADDKMPWDD